MDNDRWYHFCYSNDEVNGDDTLLSLSECIHLIDDMESRILLL